MAVVHVFKYRTILYKMQRFSYNASNWELSIICLSIFQVNNLRLNAKSIPWDQRYALISCSLFALLENKHEGQAKFFFHKIKIGQNNRTIKSQTNVSAFASVFMCSFRNALNVFTITTKKHHQQQKKKHYTETVILQFYVFNKLWYFIDHLYSLTEHTIE